MRFTLRWFGDDDPVSLDRIRQTPGLDGVVSSLYGAPAGEAWSVAAIHEHQQLLAEAGLTWLVVESVPVSDDIKLGGGGAEEARAAAHTDAWCATLANLAEAGVRTVCYNFMPVFDWIRTDFAMPLGDGSNAMAYREADLTRFDFSQGMTRLAAWANGYTAAELQAAFARARAVSEEALFDRLVAFLEVVAPEAERLGVKLAIHPDDPPWPIYGLPRTVHRMDHLARILEAVDVPANGLTFCTGALGARVENDLIPMASRFADRIHFLHARNIRRFEGRDFAEVAHHPSAGDLDLAGVLGAVLAARAQSDGAAELPIRPDHGRMIWGEEAIPGYGLYDRAIGLGYLQGVVEGWTRAHQAGGWRG